MRGGWGKVFVGIRRSVALAPKFLVWRRLHVGAEATDLRGVWLLIRPGKINGHAVGGDLGHHGAALFGEGDQAVLRHRVQ